jgi:hypothetical protein
MKTRTQSKKSLDEYANCVDYISSREIICVCILGDALYFTMCVCFVVSMETKFNVVRSTADSPKLVLT